MRRWRPLLCCAVALFATSLSARAQLPDSALITSDAARRGFAAISQYERTRDLTDASAAALAFSTAIKANPQDAWSHYGLALTLQRARKTINVVRAQGVADGEAAKVAVRLLERALELDPEFVLAAQLLELAAEHTRNYKAQARAFAVLERMGKLDVPGPQSPENIPPGALGLLHRARSQFQQADDVGGTEFYLAGINGWDAATADAYVADALLVADDQEVIALTDGALDKRAAALRTFWKKRSVRDGVSIAARIGEHYRRLAYARSRYSIPPGRHGLRDINGKVKTGIAAELDDRGAVYVRYGPPSEPKAWNIDRHDVGILTWAYLDADGRYNAFHFAEAGGRPPMYRLITDLLNSGSRGAAMSDFLSDIARYDARYALIALRLESINTLQRTLRLNPSPANRSAYFIRQEQQDVDRMNARITIDNLTRLSLNLQRDRAHPQFTQPLTVFHDFATFRGNGCTDLVYTVAAAAPSYRLNVAVADTFAWDTQDVDAIVAKDAKPGEYLRSTGVFCTPPDHNAFVRLTVSTDSASGVTAGGSVSISDYAPRTGLLMSDLLFATAADGPFTRGNVQLALVPPRQFRQNEPFRVFYELYNLPRGNPYKTDITFETVRGNVFSKLFRGRGKTTVSFEDAAVTGDVVQELRTLIPEVEAGEVRVTIRITDLRTRETAARNETIWILPVESSSTGTR